MRSLGRATGIGGKGCPGDWWKHLARGARDRSSVVWLISRFESSGVVLLVIPREARRPMTRRGERQREREREPCGLSGLAGKVVGCAHEGARCGGGSADGVGRGNVRG